MPKQLGDRSRLNVDPNLLQGIVQCPEIDFREGFISKGEMQIHKICYPILTLPAVWSEAFRLRLGVQETFPRYHRSWHHGFLHLHLQHLWKQSCFRWWLRRANVGIYPSRLTVFSGGRVAIVLNNNHTPGLWWNKSNKTPPNVSPNRSAHFVVLVQNYPEHSVGNLGPLP